MQLIQERDTLHIINAIRRFGARGVYIHYDPIKDSYVGLAVIGFDRSNKESTIPMFDNKWVDVENKIETQVGKTTFYFTTKDFMYYYTPNRF